MPTMNGRFEQRWILMAMGGVLVLTPLVAVGIFWSERPDQMGDVAPLAVGQVDPVSGEEPMPRSSVSPAAPAASPDPTDLEDQLARFHGADWPERRKFLVEEGFVLEGRPPLPPWSEVEDALGEKLLVLPETRAHILAEAVDWPEELTNEWIQQRFAHGFELSDLDKAELEELVGPVHAELRSVVERYLDDLDAAIAHQFALGKVVRAPFTTVGMPGPPSEGHFYSSAQSHRGWTCKLSLAAADFPHVTAAQADIQDRKRQRNQLVRARLEQLRKHH